MSTTLRITPVPHPGGITLLLQGGALPTGGAQVQRQLPQLNAELMERFRRTALTRPQFAELSNSITDWLLDTQVRGILGAALPANGGGLRIVFVLPDAARATFGQLPLELLWHDAPSTPLVLRGDVQSVVYLLDKSRSHQGPQAIMNWPFKALIVRAGPVDLEAVPEVGPLAEEIRQMGAHYGQRMVQVDVISSEPGIGGRATWRALRDQLRRTSDYNILVYVGHGESVPSTTGGEPIGQLFMESEDGGGHQPLSAAQLARLLRPYPIGMVLLAGCLTGDDPAGTSRLRGGELGVAQALVNSSEAGVQVAVAMRTELQATAATLFVRSFFRSLLDIKPDPSGNRPAGDIDRAVRAAREELFLDSEFPPQWAAPIVLRAIEREPFLEFLAHPVKFHVTRTMDMLLALRATLSSGMADYSLAAGVPELLQGRQTALDDVKARIRAEGLQQGPLLLPRDLPVGAGQTKTAVVDLAGPLQVSMLTGRVTASGDNWVKQITLPPNVAAQFKLMIDPGDPGSFELRTRTAATTQVPEGELLHVQIGVPPAASPGVYPFRIEVLDMAPAGIIWPGDGVVIVPRP